MKKFVVFFLVIFFSCSKNESEKFIIQDILGRYKIESFYATELADLNGDKTSSKDFKSELLDFFNESPLKLSQLPEQDPFDVLFSIYLPYPNEIVDKPYGHLLYDLYALPKTLKFNGKDFNTHENEANFENKIVFKTFKLLENNKIQIVLKIKLYDFKKLTWKNYNCTITYFKDE